MARNNEFPAFPQGGFILGAVLEINHDLRVFLSTFYLFSSWILLTFQFLPYLKP